MEDATGNQLGPNPGGLQVSVIHVGFACLGFHGMLYLSQRVTDGVCLY
jgi:hypothetical protein